MHITTETKKEMELAPKAPGSIEDGALTAYMSIRWVDP